MTVIWCLQNVCESVQLKESGGVHLSACGIAFSPNGSCIAVASAAPAAPGTTSPRLQACAGILTSPPAGFGNTRNVAPPFFPQVLAIADYSDISPVPHAEQAVKDATWKSKLEQQLKPAKQACAPHLLRPKQCFLCGGIAGFPLRQCGWGCCRLAGDGNGSLAWSDLLTSRGSRR